MIFDIDQGLDRKLQAALDPESHPISRSEARARERLYFQLYEAHRKKQQELRQRLSDPERTRFKWCQYVMLPCPTEVAYMQAPKRNYHASHLWFRDRRTLEGISSNYSTSVPYNVLRWVPDIMHCIGLDTKGLRLHDTLLLNKNFDSRQNVAGHKRPHSRFVWKSLLPSLLCHLYQTVLLACLRYKLLHLLEI